MPHRQFSKPNLSKTEKEAEALRHVLGWLNDQQKKVLRGYVCNSKDRLTERYRQLRLLMSFAGIDSYWGTRAYFRFLLKR